MNPLDEAGAWGRAAAGDGDAFGRLFDAHHRRVFRHGLRLTGDVHDAEDVLAAAFLELWRRRKDVRVLDGSVLPWLLVTAGNLALNQGRGPRRHRAFLARLPRQERQVDPAEVQALLRADLDVDPHLLAAIKTLSSTDQQLLALVALVALEDYPLRAAAEALGLTGHAARSRWQRIRRRLAQNRTPTCSPSRSRTDPRRPPMNQIQILGPILTAALRRELVASRPPSHATPAESQPSLRAPSELLPSVV